MTSKSWISRVSALLIALLLTTASPMQTVEDARKVSVLSLGLFGDQRVFRNEATGAAQVACGEPVNVPDHVSVTTLSIPLRAPPAGVEADPVERATKVETLKPPATDPAGVYGGRLVVANVT
jgi:hypothetical protein